MFRRILPQEQVACFESESSCGECVLQKNFPGIGLVLLVGSCILFGLFLFCGRAWSADSPVVLNEAFVDGTSNYPDWIELYNKGDKSVSLKGYALTSNLEEPRWRVKDNIILHPGTFKVFYCDGLQRYDHTGFGLDSISGEVGLFAPDDTLVDSVSYSNLPRFSSLGRWANGRGGWFIHGSPTKGSANQSSSTSLRRDQMMPVSFSSPSGRYDNAFELTLSAPEGYQVYYTTDGSLPGPNSFLYNSPLSISKTTIVRAAAVGADSKAFAPVTRSYILGKDTRLPVVSVVTDPVNLWDQDIGIYADGEAQNWRNNWRRPVHLDFLAEDGNWDVEGQMRIFGGTSRSCPQKSLAIYTTDKANPYKINRQLFPGFAQDRFAGIVLRNGGDTWLRTQIRDSFQQILVQGRVACDTHPYRPVVAYINGEYWGIYGLRELMSRKNLLVHHHLPLQRIVLLDNGHSIASSKGPFTNMPPIPEKGDYRPALEAINIDAFLDYIAVETYSGNTGWPYRNIKCWRPKSKQIKWQWLLYDLDRGFSGKRGKSVDNNPFTVLFRYPGIHGMMFSSLSKNPQFVRDFCSRMVVHVLTTFKPERALKILDHMAGEIRPEMKHHINRWRWDWKLTRLFMTTEDWEQNLDQLREFCIKRPGIMLSILDRQFGVGKPLDTCINVATQGQGHVFAENIPLDDGRLEGPVPASLDIVVSVKPALGYVFKGWTNHSNEGPQVRVKAGQTFKDSALFETIDTH